MGYVFFICEQWVWLLMPDIEWVIEWVRNIFILLLNFIVCNALFVPTSLIFAVFIYLLK